MRINLVCKGVLVAATLCVGPAVLLASPKGDQPGAVNKGAFPNDTLFLLQQIRSDALDVKNNADQLRTLLRAPMLNDWQVDAEYLEDASADVNQMNKLFSRLRANEGNASPQLRDALMRIASTAVNLAGTTQDAVNTLHNNELHVYATDLDGLAQDMFNQASLISQTVGDLDKYMDARHEEQQLQKTLGLKNQP